MKRMPGAARAVALIAVLITTACSAPATTERFFALAPAATAQASVPATAGTRAIDESRPGIVITAVTIPEIVDRVQIVTRDGSYRVVLSEQNQWAEPLKQGVVRVLSSQLRRAVDAAGISARVGAYPQSSIVDPAVRIVVDVQRFEAAPGGEAVVDVAWSIRRDDGASRTGRTRATRPVASTDYSEIVGAWNGALVEVGDTIGAAVVAMGPIPFTVPVARPVR